MSHVYDDIVLKQLKIQEYGWLTAFGVIYTCTMYNHCSLLMDIFKDDEIVKQMISRKDDDESRALEEQYSWMEDHPDDHPEWHHTEMYLSGLRDDLHSDIVNYAYSLGWARIGIMRAANAIEFEMGNTSYQHSLQAYGKEIATLLDMNYKENVVKIRKIK